jgi:hypothetical protein
MCLKYEWHHLCVFSMRPAVLMTCIVSCSCYIHYHDEQLITMIKLPVVIFLDVSNSFSMPTISICSLYSTIEERTRQKKEDATKKRKKKNRAREEQDEEVCVCVRVAIQKETQK